MENCLHQYIDQLLVLSGDEYGADHGRARLLFEDDYDPLAATCDDPDHSLGEHRFLTVGYAPQGRSLLYAILSGEAPYA